MSETMQSHLDALQAEHRAVGRFLNLIEADTVRNLSRVENEAFEALIAARDAVKEVEDGRA